ncbi:TonB-dependent receptor domain-containing protein [Chitinophaga tropicalis]|uniref:TonB-dependent receptor n=1 Tax=Chitinophaga tropicalis TaxID=2683588 RepID=A0A7K1U4P6_9BACT|nr:TonB-dependent receptor [Chitinophaga tropicalis]MVT09333.1 TonB-dependent receptor [Chitinophaga tropicalis]
MKYIVPFLFLLFSFIHGYTQTKVTVSGQVKDAGNKAPLQFVNVTLHKVKDSTFVTGTITDQEGRFSIADIGNGNYFVKISLLGYGTKQLPVLVGQLSQFLDLGAVPLSAENRQLKEVTVAGREETVTEKMDRKVFKPADNISQMGGSVLEAMKNLPGITVSQDGKVQLRGSDKVMVLLDGKQTALTGIGGQSGLDNIPASAIERIEIINNPSARYDANGNAGIINIIYKKESKEGFNGKIGLAGGLGALWEKKGNYPGIRPQYRATPKINPSVFLNYRKNKVNLFLQADDLYTKTLNKNEFTDRFYSNGDTIRQQTKRNRTTNIITVKTGMDWFMDNSNTITFSALGSREKILDRGDEPFFNKDLSERQRLWQFLEDEVKTTATISAGWQHRFAQPGRSLNIGFNYTFHREDERYYFNNIMPAFTGLDSFRVLSDEHVADLNIDYIHPLKYGRVEGGMKFRRRYIPTNMKFMPGLNSPLDTSAGGWANYSEVIPAVYGNYVLETNKFEVEAGIRMEYVNLEYKVNPHHKTYKSDGYNYTEPFPNLRIAYKLNDRNKLSFFYNRRVDRPNEVDIRIFPKYDDVGTVKVGNPGLRPQFTSSFELGYKAGWNESAVYSAVYHKRMDATITRIGTTVPGSDIIYNIFQNTGKSYNTGIEMLLSQNIGKKAALSLNLNGYQHIIEAYTVVNMYPEENVFSAARQETYSGNIKLNSLFHFSGKTDLLLTAIYLAPDIVPQGKTYSRFSIDAGIKKAIQQGRGEVFLNATDIANTLRNKMEIRGDGFKYRSTDYNETQVIRVGYSYKL